MVWGYRIPGLKHPVVNTRVESASKKDVWKDGWNRHRCIVPASWYYEWEHIRYLVNKYALDPDQTWYVGDRSMDVLSAKDAGVRAVLLLPDGSRVLPTGREDRIIRFLREI